MKAPSFFLIEVLVLQRFPREKNSTFFYFIAEKESVKVGDLVEVPWRKGKIKAIVVAKDLSALRKYSPKGADLIVDFRYFFAGKKFFYSSIPARAVRVRPVSRILQSDFVQPDFLLNLKKLAEKHFVSWNHLALLILKMPIKSRRSQIFILDKIRCWLEAAREGLGANEEKNKGAKLESVREIKDKDYIFINYNQREEFRQLLSSVLRKGRQILVVTPERQMLHLLAAKYAILGDELASSSPVVISPSDPPFWFRGAWNLTRNWEQKIFIGTRSAVFAPFGNLGLIILENGNSDHYKQWDLNPRFDIRKVIPQLYPKATKVYLSNAPRVEDFSLSAKILASDGAKVTIKKYKVAAKLPLIKKIEEEGGGSSYRIAQNFSYRGENKKIILVDSEVENRLADKKCFLGACFLKEMKKQVSKGELSIILGSGGSLAKAERELVEVAKWRQQDLLLLAGVKEEADLKKMEVFMRSAAKKKRVLLAGHGLIPFINIMRHSKTAVFLPKIDEELFASDFRSEEKTLGRIFSCLAFAEKIFIRTKTSAHPIFQILKRGQYLAFFPRWLQERKKFGYPPEFKLFKLIAVELRSKEAKAKAERLAAILETWPTVRDAILSFEAEKTGKRGVYWSVIVRAKQDFPFEELRKILPSGFLFDPDPETLK